MNTRHIVLLAITTASIAFLGCKKKDEEKKPDAGLESTQGVHIVSAKVTVSSFEDWGNYSADLRGANDAVLTSGMGGRVTNVLEVGRAVKAGQALCDIESNRFQAIVMQAQSQVDVAKNEVERMKTNVDKGFVGKTALDNANLGYQAARVAYLQAQRTYEDSRCQAPFTGILVSRTIEKFQTIGPGMPTVRLSSIDKLEAVVAIPENESSDFTEGEKAAFYLIQDTTKVFYGKLKSLDKAVESRNRTVTARIEIPNTGLKLRPGMVGRARILRKTFKDAIMVPSQAVLRLQEGTFVMLYVEGKAKQVPVTLGRSEGNTVQVLTGLKADDNLIVTGGFQVSDGMSIKN